MRVGHLHEDHARHAADDDPFAELAKRHWARLELWLRLRRGTSGPRESTLFGLHALRVVTARLHMNNLAPDLLSFSAGMLHRA